MKTLLKVFVSTTLAIALLVGAGMLLFERIPPSKIGVRRNLWQGGIDQADFLTGFHLGIFGLHKWDLLDRRTHFLTFAEKNDRLNNASERPALDLRTRDNNTAVLEATITYRIIPDSAHKLVAEGFKIAYRDRVASTVEGVLREELAKLSPEEFFDTDTRLARVEQTLPILRAEMAEYYVEPEAILVRAVRFPSEYEKKLQEKQLTRQRALLAPAKQKVEEQLQITGVIEKETIAQQKERTAEWDKRLQQARSDNQVQIAQIRADAEVYDKQTRSGADATFLGLVADGDLALEKAEALRNELRNQALDTKGGRILLASRAAENLRIEEVTLNSNDPSVPTVIDVDALVKLLVGNQQQ
jgi:hypothetical protein